MERSGELPSREQRVFGNLNSTNTGPTMQRIQRELSPSWRRTTTQFF
jgi:hypothetical protein